VSGYKPENMLSALRGENVGTVIINALGAFALYRASEQGKLNSNKVKRIQERA
jgi:hypothetical protein